MRTHVGIHVDGPYAAMLHLLEFVPQIRTFGHLQALQVGAIEKVCRQVDYFEC
jgi:hypothetical protein